MARLSTTNATARNRPRCTALRSSTPRRSSLTHHRPVRPIWAKLLKPVFDLDLEHCPNCGVELKIIAAIRLGEPGHNGPEDRLCLANARASVPWPLVIEEILAHLGLQARAPPRAPARGQALQAA